MLEDSNLDLYRRRAAELLKLAQSHNKDSHTRLRRFHAELASSSMIAEEVTLQHAQQVIARENGFSNWMRLKGYLATLEQSSQQSSPERLQTIIRTRDLEVLHEFIERVPSAIQFRIEPTGNTALHEAAAQDWLDGVELLLESGADINATAAKSGMTPLQLAVGYGFSALARWLLQHDADPAIETTAEKSTMKIAASANDRTMIQALVDRGLQADIFAAITLQDETLIRKLTIVDASVLQQRLRLHEAITLLPLHLAAIHNLSRVLDLLIYLGADVNGVDEQNRTAIDLALHTGKREAYERLLSHGCAPNEKLLELVQTPERSERIARLHTALVKGNKAKAIEELDADPSLINQRLPDVWGSGGTFGAAPLHWAAMFGHIDIASVLLERGADLNLRDLTHDSTPIDWAKEYRRQEMVAFLAMRGK
ncbi:MAG TPA: ankyrin repeat domain-containing protein [Steroidobacteraceae bacterium]|nr:ankyrin repeat domain-containing protein [Steroidobacteraceae bacterium]